MLFLEVKSFKEEFFKKILVMENLLKKVEYLFTEVLESERKLSSCEE